MLEEASVAAAADDVALEATVTGAAHSAASPHAQRLATHALAYLRDHPEVSVDELLTAVMRRFPGQRRERLAGLLDEAVAAGLLHHDSLGRISAPNPGPAVNDTARGAAAPASTADTAAQFGLGDPAEEPPTGAFGVVGRIVRAVVVDLESVVQTTTSDPYTDKRIYQIGAVRLSNDSAWVAEQPRFSAYVELPDDTWVIRSKRVREAHAAAAVSPRRALEDLHAYTDGTDLIVTYNGTQADFPLLSATAAREDMPDLRGSYVDAFYLTLAFYPTATRHALAPLADDLGIDRRGLGWHDAVDDSELLARVLRHCAQTFVALPADRQDLLASLTADSLAWTLVRSLAAGHVGAPPDELLGDERVHTVAEVAGILHSGLAGHLPRRSPTGAVGRSAVTVNTSLRGTDGKVDVTALARAVRPGAALRQPQTQMTQQMHTWADQASSGLVEAPTGTGKSFAVLAVALDWLAGAPDRTAIITTATKHLQAQMAADVTRLEAAIPGLLRASDVVKGKANRLSLRALTLALTDATALLAAPTVPRRSRSAGRNHFLERVIFRELLAYLTLRLIASTTVEQSWTAHSVDPVDVPLFFTGYSNNAVSIWLESLSQATSGEYEAVAPTPLAAHTDGVREALLGHRLILANHALLLAHLDELSDLGPDTLLILDEAHQLEDSATSALTATLDYRLVEDLYSELDSWTRDARPGAERDQVSEGVRNLGLLLDHEALPKVSGQVFDARGTGVGTLVGARTVTLASPYSGACGTGQVRYLMGQLLRLSGMCDVLVGTLSAYRGTHATTMGFYDLERLDALVVGAAEVSATAQRIVADTDDALGLPTPGPGPDGGPGMDDNDDSTGTEPDAAADDLSGDTDETLPLDPISEPDPDMAEDLTGTGDGDPIDHAGTGDGAVPALGALPPGTTNQVVFAEEVEALRAELRRYRFRISTSPIELPADSTWQQFLATFNRTYYVSATLRVAAQWTFIRTRLGLRSTVPTLHLPTPFDMRNQAELVCLADFPSWAEQSDGAMRTVAHQLTGYTRELIQPVLDEDDEPEDYNARGGYRGGAMVLTTAKSTAAGISQYLSESLRRDGDTTPVHSAVLLGNPRAVRQFDSHTDGGGILVGTKGLWQGVDIADPDRLRLVWINKLPFAPFAAPVIEARRAAVFARADAAHAEDPDAVATETYYLPLAALHLRQAVGRLIRSEQHRGVVIISDRKLAGHTALRRAYRKTFLGSLDADLLRTDPLTGERAGGNVMSMAKAWARIWDFYARNGLLDPARASELSTPQALLEHTVLPQTLRIRELTLTVEDVARHRARGTLVDEVLKRCAQVGGLLKLSDTPTELKNSQQAVITAVAEGRNALGLLPTGFGKSYCFQLPALVLPGVTLIISPLVALMHDQALELNASIGGAVRALVAPLRESSSRAGKTEIADQLLGRVDHHIKLIYASPERLGQRRFRQIVAEAVRTGVISRIVIDEAHTVVQWDDFRPSMRRAAQFLARLRADHGLTITALTATANRTVHTGLRSQVFGLDADIPAVRSAEALAEASAAGPTGLVTVRENPIRPELALFRRSISPAGPAVNAGLAEEVVDHIADHAIFYCLTVRDVVALHAHLRDYVGDGNVRVRRFHGRLTEAEKHAVMTEFREAPRRGDEGFAPMLIVATSAFGLGINRPDIRTVFCVSTPTDLSQLYQQVGRAGRDVAGSATTDRSPVDGTAASTPGVAPTPPANVGLALLTPRGLRTARFMTTSDLPPPLLARMGEAVLAIHSGVLDASTIADRLIAEDVDACRLSRDDAAKSRTSEQYTSGVVRAFSALSALDVVDDLGDFPPLCAIKPGELRGNGDRDTDPTEQAVVDAILALPGRSDDRAGLHRARLHVPSLHRHLSATVEHYADLADDPPSTWQLLADLHDRGELDVSAAPSRKLVTGIAVHTRTLPAGYAGALAGKAARAAEEIRLLRDFFTDRNTCANQKFADYFGVDTLPDGCCSTAANRCSACWDNDTTIPVGQKPPAVGDALNMPKPRLAGARTDSGVRRKRLDEQVYRLVWADYRGVHARDVCRALRGEDSYYHPTRRRRVRLRHNLVVSRYFGAQHMVKLDQVEDSLARLEADGRVVPLGYGKWRERGHADRAAAVAARAATPVPAGTAP
ncbi:DEAD/DEAH box helicase [Actinokineospora auranticolor]|uniref:DNA 3'-5' helicase n=1 Tax=Actinokineospora auranticolor TaxID=155976 RepID=A0A2S6GP96_9PSEU|nr:DEAD/DEAH box helicase [Actinokineospora auranticolor]PPK67027.1 RAD3-like DEAD/DEAH box helicase [Actinokineospora auranticolor]